jgi:N-acetyl-alpha-D-muramate 1-phosphate uridylyltransferase
MKALIFAAGRGERMRPLTEHTPKPLLEAGGKPLIAWHLEKLAGIGVRDVVINTSHLAERFPATLGDGSRWNLRIHYCHEGPEPLETGGGMRNALPLLDGPCFIAIAGDIWTDFDLRRLPAEPAGRAHLLLVDNPAHHPDGDFVLGSDGVLALQGGPRLTFSGVGLYRPSFLLAHALATAADPVFKLRPLFEAAISQREVSGSHHPGQWTDVGTPARLSELDVRLRGPH